MYGQLDGHLAGHGRHRVVHLGAGGGDDAVLLGDQRRPAGLRLVEPGDRPPVSGVKVCEGALRVSHLRA